MVINNHNASSKQPQMAGLRDPERIAIAKISSSWINSDQPLYFTLNYGVIWHQTTILASSNNFPSGEIASVGRLLFRSNHVHVLQLVLRH